ncbi:MAG TPA: hypothetical protein VMR08_04225 [Patescibacteria group bacterium]|jgi:hypothetical protein|nr:hypothetical protein [Patescibacteria group bacterium]
MSYYFDACNIISSEASAEARDRLAGKTIERALYVFDETGGSSPTRLATTAIQPFSYDVTRFGDNYPVELLLAKPLPTEGSDPDPDPRLLAVIQGDLAVPLATFAPRTGGKCSYMQIGQEITDDSFVVTPYDKRKDIADAIRSLIRGNKPADEQPLIDLIQLETVRSLEQILPQLAPALCRHVRRIYERSSIRKTRPLWMLSQEGASLQTPLVTPWTETRVQLADNRRVELLLAAPLATPIEKKSHGRKVPNYDKNAIDLLAVTRGNVAIPIVRFSEDDVINPQTNEPFNYQQIQNIRKLVIQPPSREAIMLFSAESYFSPERLLQTIQRVAKFKHNSAKKQHLSIAAAITEEYLPEQTGRMAGIPKDPKEYQDMKNLIAKRQMDGEAISWLDVDAKWRHGTLMSKGANRHLARELHNLVRQRNVERKIDNDAKKHSSVAATTFRKIGADKVIDSYLGEYDPLTENLFSVVGRLASQGSNFRGLLKDVMINQSNGNVELAAQIEARPDQTFFVRLEGGAAGMRSMGRREIYPPMELSKTKRVELEPRDIEEMIQLLGALSVVPN